MSRGLLWKNTPVDPIDRVLVKLAVAVMDLKVVCYIAASAGSRAVAISRRPFANLDWSAMRVSDQELEMYLI